MRILNVLLAVVIGLSIVGCTHGGGTKVSQEQLSTIKKGVTTRTELVTTLGQPSSSRVEDDGTETLYWTYVSVTGAPVPFATHTTETSVLEVTLNKEKIVDHYNMSQGGQQFK